MTASQDTGLAWGHDRDMYDRDMYDVLLLIEQAISPADAVTVTGLHEAIEDTVNYHVVLPVDDPAAGLEASLGALATSEMLGTAPMYLANQPDVEQEHQEALRRAGDVLAASIRTVAGTGVHADGELTETDPVQRLVSLVAERDSAEVIILTRPHLVAETLHVDWTHKARKRLGVPVLHLLAHGGR